MSIASSLLAHSDLQKSHHPQDGYSDPACVHLIENPLSEVLFLGVVVVRSLQQCVGIDGSGENLSDEDLLHGGNGGYKEEDITQAKRC